MEPDAGFGSLFKDRVSLPSGLYLGLLNRIGLFQKPSFPADGLFDVPVVEVALKLKEAILFEHANFILSSWYPNGMVALL